MPSSQFPRSRMAIRPKACQGRHCPCQKEPRAVRLPPLAHTQPCQSRTRARASLLLELPCSLSIDPPRSPPAVVSGWLGSCYQHHASSRCCVALPQGRPGQSHQHRPCSYRFPAPRNLNAPGTRSDANRTRGPPERQFRHPKPLRYQVRDVRKVG